MAITYVFSSQSCLVCSLAPSDLTLRPWILLRDASPLSMGRDVCTHFTTLQGLVSDVHWSGGEATSIDFFSKLQCHQFMKLSLESWRLFLPSSSSKKILQNTIVPFREQKNSTAQHHLDLGEWSMNISNLFFSFCRVYFS